MRVALMAVAVALGPALTTRAQPPRTLPSPGGPLAVGRVSVQLIDPTRIEPLSPNHGYRELMVDVWYPADPSAGKTADYLDAPAFERALGAAGFQQHFGEASDVIKAGAVQTHAVSGAPFSRAVSRSPLLIFSPGGGMVREVYSAQIEDLVSHGYVVAAITHTYDGIVAVFPDGHVVTSRRQTLASDSICGRRAESESTGMACKGHHVRRRRTRAREPGDVVPLAVRWTSRALAHRGVRPLLWRDGRRSCMSNRPPHQSVPESGWRRCDEAVLP